MKNNKCKHSEHQLHAQHDSLVLQIDVGPLRHQTLNGSYVSSCSCQMNGGLPFPAANTRQITPPHSIPYTQRNNILSQSRTTQHSHFNTSANILVMKLMRGIIRHHQLHAQHDSLVRNIFPVATSVRSRPLTQFNAQHSITHPKSKAKKKTTLLEVKWC